jgi:hypothetical protein
VYPGLGAKHLGRSHTRLLLHDEGERVVQEGGDVRRHLAGVHHAVLLLLARDAGHEATCPHRKQLNVYNCLRVLPPQNSLAVLSPPEGEEAQVVNPFASAICLGVPGGGRGVYGGVRSANQLKVTR